MWGTIRSQERNQGTSSSDCAARLRKTGTGVSNKSRFATFSTSVCMFIATDVLSFGFLMMCSTLSSFTTRLPS